MSGSYIKVSFSTLEGGAQSCRSTAGQIRQQLDDLRAEVQRLAGEWEGEAQAAYQAKQQQWDQAAGDLQQVLERIATALSEAAQQYQATEQANAAIWGG
ncbi:WXG100 family type VII secretion target [Carbonactinospora thermoautotrophica]|uniref:ESAT-6-like protein n=1 Tax=Carbonactinospora thermoautotrophica TaxID=1469144 RepID=A0A132MK17_9ACTN|nr:WXG100 family type VII secretion target [Carbonactinospora thermoautotrophica]KWW98123.1 hypothetical protein TH66_22985 [Carbonactinospora thermoautotrophica]KWX02868.1 hypothetical protein LI90_3915 [Carbonactinospora thermoautotrophica]KWX10157.1 hypothetical protein TR74_05310 [Carbonactinospora thermoautotrophica]MCX9192704.1 WXG100 family type VII secretion target [Carbonactinospora thermoautotrophica]